MDDFFSEYTTYPWYMKALAKKYLDKMTYTVGVGRHSKEEVDEMLKHDLTMLSELLGWYHPNACAIATSKPANQGS